MAAVTQDTSLYGVFGDLRYWVGQIDIANDADTQDVGFSQVLYASAVSATNAAIGATISSGVVTWQTGGAEANCQALIIGR
jgi:hypothetical protein